MTTFISFIFVLGILIFIHELGHFLLAKRIGVEVEKFSLGFGPRLVGVRRGETDYVISALPLGGYVKLRGEDPGEELTNDPRELNSRSIGERLWIFGAGSLMNLILPFMLMPIVYLIGIQMPSYLDKEPLIGWVMEDSPAENSGLRPGDEIISINGEGIETWEELRTTIMANPGQELLIELKRGKQVIQRSLVSERDPENGTGSVGIVPPMRPIIGEVSPGYPAEEAGLREGDMITAIDGRQVSHWVEMSQIIRGNPDKELSFLISRGEGQFTADIRPKFNEEAGVGLIGIARYQETTLKKYKPLPAVVEGCKRVFVLFKLTFVVIGKLFTLNLSIKSLGGPIMIAQVASQAARSGFTDLLALMAFLSLQLGILNLLPIPVLDGGHLLFLGIESVLGRPVSIRRREIAQQIGVFLLISLMAVVFYNDILRTWGEDISRLFDKIFM
ncbi:MAG: RIP metalloprotease RseP [Deltaproteobacteria bacterium]|nr:MAG: RIP metalloprotease RseP [Deltaproteobacteria bacterium]